MKTCSSILMLLLLCSQVAAQSLSPIVDISDNDRTGDPKAAVKAEPNAQRLQQSEQYYQVQILKDEVRALRGMLEEVNHQLQQIKQRQMDDYLDIDRRLLSITSTAVVPQAAATTTHVDPSQGSSDPVEGLGVNLQLGGNSDSANSVQTVDMKTDYDNASSLLLKNRDLDGAAAAFQNHIDNFPKSPYVANSYYWLGEIYLLQGQQAQSLQAFRRVVDDHPDHSKAMDARFKLGKLYHELGEIRKAKSLLREAANSSGGAGAKARAYLQANKLQ